MKTTACKPLQTRSNRSPMSRYTLQIKRVPIDLQGSCIFLSTCINFVHLDCIIFLQLYVYVFDF